MAKNREELVQRFRRKYEPRYASDYDLRLFEKLYRKLDELIVLGFEVIQFTPNGKFCFKRPPNISPLGVMSRILEAFDGDQYLAITFTGHKIVWVSYRPHQDKEKEQQHVD